MAGHPGGTEGETGADRSVRVSVPEKLAGEAGAVLMDSLGPFEEERPRPDSFEAKEGQEPRVTLVFYPSADGPSTREELLPLLPAAFPEPDSLRVETGEMSRDWVEGWREHFRPIVVGAVRIRPPWEPPLAPAAKPLLVDVVINPGLGFGTGLHPTTRGTLLLLQEGRSSVEGGLAEGLAPGSSEGLAPGSAEGLAPGSAEGLAPGSAPLFAAGRGPLVDVGTGSGILAIAAAKLGWTPVVALDNDPVALVSARENVAANGVQGEVEIHEADAITADEKWFREATVLANMTLEPVSLLVRRLGTLPARPCRLVVSGILAGSQEEQVMLTAHEAGFTAGRRLYEEEWVSLELLPDRAEG